jgi:3-methyl-2-oxobutanoate hydroxymethyltransferase
MERRSLCLPLKGHTKLWIQPGIDVILVGDSASNVMAGHETTLPITLDQMIYASSVVRQLKEP